MNRIASTALAAITAAMVAACGASGPNADPVQSTPQPSPSPAKLIVDGWISVDIDPRSVADTVLKDDEAFIGETPCEPKPGYDDIAAGTQVTITDEKGAVVALGELTEAGLWADDPEELVITSDCRFDFLITVPAGPAFYGIEIAHRGVVRYAASDLDDEIRLKLT